MTKDPKCFVLPRHAPQTLAGIVASLAENGAKRLECVRLAGAFESLACGGKREQAPRTPNAGASFGSPRVKGRGAFSWLMCALFMVVRPASLFAQQTGPPVLQIQPSNQTVFAGSTVMFTVAATGAQPLSYQWFKLPTGIITNATNATLTIQGVDDPDAGAYFVRVTNFFGRVPSTNASLVVIRAADLGVSASVTPNPIPLTSNAQCEVSVTNAGPSFASNVFITNTLSGVDFLSVQAGTAGCTVQGNQIICSIGGLQAREGRTILFIFHPRQRSLLTNVVAAGSDVFDPKPSNNQLVLMFRAGEALVITTQPQDVKVRVGD